MDRLDEMSGPNHITLRRGRLNFERIGAADPSAEALVASADERAGLRREQRATFN